MFTSTNFYLYLLHIYLFYKYRCRKYDDSFHRDYSSVYRYIVAIYSLYIYIYIYIYIFCVYILYTYIFLY